MYRNLLLGEIMEKRWSIRCAYCCHVLLMHVLLINVQCCYIWRIHALCSRSCSDNDCLPVVHLLVSQSAWCSIDNKQQSLISSNPQGIHSSIHPSYHSTFSQTDRMTLPVPSFPDTIVCTHDNRSPLSCDPSLGVV